MPIATPETYAQMLDRAREGRFAYPAINVTSSQTLIAALRGFAEAESDGIVQVSTGGAEYLSGSTVKDMVLGAQVVGRQAAAKRIDALAVAIWNEMTVDEVLSLDLSYAPPFSPVWDPVLIAARKAFEAVEADVRLL